MLELDLSFRALTQLFKEHDVKLTRGQTSIHFPKCCPYAALAFINNSNYMMFDMKISEKDYIRLSSIEAGFEGWDCEPENYKSYYKIGQRLYKWSQLNQKDTPQS